MLCCKGRVPQKLKGYEDEVRGSSVLGGNYIAFTRKTVIVLLIVRGRIIKRDPSDGVKKKYSWEMGVLWVKESELWGYEGIADLKTNDS